MVQYEKIDCDLPDMEGIDLSTDQIYLYKIAKAVKSGECSSEFSATQPGTLNHEGG